MSDLPPLDATTRERLQQNRDGVRQRIAAAARAAGRDPAAVQLVCVVKYAELPWVQGLYELGEREFGEARPQQLAERVALLPSDVRWHLIGSLQRNKVGPTLDALGAGGLIHSVDSSRLLDRVARLAAERSRVARVLLQVNVTGEATKQGLVPDEVAGLVASSAASDAVAIEGLMTMAAKQGDAAATFEQLAALSRTLPSELPVLSMGMSGDLEAAIAAGATHVRIGSALFEGLARCESRPE